MATALWQRFEGVTVDGKYLLHRLLGSGGNGGVFEAEPLGQDVDLKHVALKLMEPAAAHQEQQLFEISGLAGLTHPSLLRSFTPGLCTIDGVRMLYLPTEMADESLEARLSAQSLNIDEVRDVGVALAAALVYLHEQARPLVHRDVKPANTMRIGARWKLGDFGLLRSVSSRGGVRTRSFMGSAEYAPPESYDGLISPAWDVWSLGILLHEAATGFHPFSASASTPQQLMNAVCSAEPTLSENLTPELQVIISACLDRDPSVRWTAERVLEAIEEMDSGSAYSSIPHVHISKRRQAASRSASEPAAAYEGSEDDRALSEHITVSASGDADCTTVIEAVRRAAAGATITVRPGHYTGAVRLERPVEIVGDGAEADIIIEAIGREAIVIESAGVRICGTTLVSRSDMHQPKHHGVSIRVGPALIERCDISCNSLACVAVFADVRDVALIGCTIHDGKTAGVLFEEGAGGTITECTLIANFGPAIHIMAGSEHSLQSCDIYNGRESGVQIDRSAVCTIHSCSIHDNQGAGIILHESGLATIDAGAIYANKHAGVTARARSKMTITECDIYANVLSGATFSGSEAQLVRCTIRDGKSNGIAVSDGADCTLEDTEITNNGFAGIKVSHSGVLRAQSCHLHNGKRNAAVIQDDGHAAFTACNIHENGQVGILVEEGGRAELTECTLHNSEEGCVAVSGAGTIDRCTYADNGKSAIEVLHGGSIAVRDCILESNRMPAVLVHGKSEAIIERCEITRNDMPGIAVGESSKALISECTIKQGIQVGMVFWDHAKGIVDRCSITECGMDGVRIMQESDPVISGCRIHTNGQYGIHVSGQSAGEITDCDLTANRAGPAFVEAGCTTASSGNQV